MEARKIAVKLRRDPRETAERHSQANPLTLECTLACGETVTETMDLRAELHAAQTPATTPLATTATVVMASGSTGPWELEFSGAQMNQTVLPDSAEDFWLVVYATNAADDLFTLGKIALTLTFDNVSQTTPPPPEPPLYATYAFRTIAVAGQSSVVAETTQDTLTLVAGTNVTLTTNAATDTITISATGGGGGGDVTGPASSTDNAITRFNGTTGKVIQNSAATLDDNGGIAADTLAISTTPTGAGGTGIFRYDTGEKVPEVGIDGITLKIGVQEYVRVYNDTPSTMIKGAVVYISGAQGNRVAVKLADASSESTSAGTIGIVAQSITAGAEGFVQISGPMYNLNTIGLTAGALLFLSETAGEWTQTDPPPPAHGVRLAYVERVHASVGSVYIKVDNGYELGELHNVSDGVTGAIAFLVKNASTNVWESKNASDSRTAMGLGTLATQSGTFSGTSSGTNTGDQTITLTGDVTGSGTGSFAATIASNAVTTSKLDAEAVTYAKIQPLAAASTLLGRGTAGGTTVREIGIGAGLTMSGDTLSASGTGDVVGPASSVDNTVARFHLTTGKLIQESSIVIDDIDATTQQNVAIRNVDPAANSAVVITPKGTGAFILGPKPDGGTTGGNLRGDSAVDFQRFRTSITQVAGASRSVILNGNSNTASGIRSVILNGNGNTASALDSTVLNGASNQATAEGASVLSGQSNVASGAASGVTGTANTASAKDSAVIGGGGAIANRIGMIALANGVFPLSEIAQRGTVVMRRQTTTATPLDLSLTGAAPTGASITTSTHFILLNNQTVSIGIRIIARSTAGADHARFLREIVISRDANAASTVIENEETIGTDFKTAGASGWGIAITALATATEGGLLITVTGAASTTINWVAFLEFVETIRA